MNTAQKLLHDLETAGGHIAADGGRLELSAPAPLPDHLINGLRKHKAEVLRLISIPRWNADDWQGFFDERSAVFEYDHELTRAEAEARAFEWAIIEWLNRNPASSEPGKCAWCENPEAAESVVVPFGTETHGHTWLHHACWEPWHQQRKELAIKALATLGIGPSNLNIVYQTEAPALTGEL